MTSILHPGAIAGLSALPGPRITAVFPNSMILMELYQGSHQELLSILIEIKAICQDFSYDNRTYRVRRLYILSPDYRVIVFHRSLSLINPGAPARDFFCAVKTLPDLPCRHHSIQN
jgi:hypothetical protein